jgi:hypothetical protein
VTNVNKKLKEGKQALNLIKWAAIIGIAVAVICFGGAIWVWSSALTAEATSHQSVYPAESMRDVLVFGGVFLLIVAAQNTTLLYKILSNEEAVI